MVKAEDFHFIINMSDNMLNRLAFISKRPDRVYHINCLLAKYKAKISCLLQQRYADASVIELETEYANIINKADLVFMVLSEKREKLVAMLTDLKNILKPTGLLMAGLFNSDVNMYDMGDFLTYLGFTDIVIDKETWDKYNTSLYLHAILPDLVSVPVHQIKVAKNKRDQ